jgi:hypothetical protein
MKRRAFAKLLAGAIAALALPALPKEEYLVAKEWELDIDGIKCAGFKAGEFLDTGYVYAPYVPVYVTPQIAEPTEANDFRYVHKEINPKYYGKIVIDNPRFPRLARWWRGLMT